MESLPDELINMGMTLSRFYLVRKYEERLDAVIEAVGGLNL